MQSVGEHLNSDFAISARSGQRVIFVADQSAFSVHPPTLASRAAHLMSRVIVSGGSTSITTLVALALRGATIKDATGNAVLSGAPLLNSTAAKK
jgi:hypothetical protein